MFAARVGAAAIAAAMTALIVPIATPAHAMDETIVEANAQRPVAKVSYADLDLRRAADVEALNARVRRAATNICINPSDRDLRLQMAGRECRDTALEGAKPQVLAAIANAGQQLAQATTITVALP
jgi:UrcA family protein